MKNNLFDKCCCICLDQRKEHWSQLKKQCKEYEIDMIPIICGDGKDAELVYDQIDQINPPTQNWQYGVQHLKHHHYNCLLAHKLAIQKAKDNNWESLLMLEDDLYILPRFHDVLSKVEIPDDWQLIYLSWWYGDENNKWNCEVERKYNEEGIIEVIKVKENIGGWHSVIVRNTLYDLILSLPMNNPLDTQMCYLRENIPSYMILPKVTHIKSIYSFTEGCTFQRKKL